MGKNQDPGSGMCKGKGHTVLELSNKICLYKNQCSGSGYTVSTCIWASWIRIHSSEVWIQIWLRIRIWILLSSCKNSNKNCDSYYFVTFFHFLYLKKDVNVSLESNMEQKIVLKKLFTVGSDPDLQFLVNAHCVRFCWVGRGGGG
jgi:hypothetical protein